MLRPLPRPRGEVRSLPKKAAAIVGLTLVGLLVPVLIAKEWDEQRATASALRWGMGIAFVIGSVPLWARDVVVRFSRRLGLGTDNDAPPEIMTLVTRGILLAVSVGLPLLV